MSWFDQSQKEIQEADKARGVTAPATTTTTTTTPAPKPSQQTSSIVFHDGASTVDSLLDKNISFDDFNLKPKILEGVYAKGYETPSVIQAKALPVILKENVNLIAQSQSGTGKTAAFGLGILQNINDELPFPQAVCLCPTLELGTQIFENIKDLAKFTKITIFTALKGTELPDEVKEHLIIGTPGTLLALLQKKKLNTKYIKLFVVDEADHMLEEGNNSLKNDTLKVRKAIPKDARVLLFSATFKEDDSDKEGAEKETKVLDFAKAIVPQPYKMILVPKEKLTLEQMKQFYVELADHNAKLDLFKEIYSTLTMGQSMVFVNTIDRANSIINYLQSDQGGKFPVEALHSDMLVDKRKKVMSDFKQAKIKVLVCTNVLSRGIDVSQVTHVINYDLPTVFKQPDTPDYATYLHRIGRTARFGKKGVAINFCAGPKDIMVINKIKEYYKTNINKITKENIKTEIKI